MENLREYLRTIRWTVDVLHKQLALQPTFKIDTFFHVMDSKLLIKLDPEFPLMVAITGSGSSGKSSLFNALLSENISVVKSKAGLSRRVLAAVPSNILQRKDILENLFEAFGDVPEPLGSPNELTEPGKPKYVASDAVPPHLVLLDTPDFDTGDKDDYANRDCAESVLSASDVLIYIFTNANYSNRQNTLFLQEVSGGVGRRKLILVYRCSRAFSEAEVIEHTMFVAKNIYDEDYRDWLSGIYRSDEEDQVALGKKLMTIRPVTGYSDIDANLKQMNRIETRHSFMSSALRDIQRDANIILQAAEMERKQVEVYREAVRIATSWAVAEALKALPQEMLWELFLKIWNKQQSRFIKTLKFVGRVSAWPANSLKKMRHKFKSKSGKPEQENAVPASDSAERFEKSLISAVNTLSAKLLSKDFSVEITDQRDGKIVDLLKKIDQLMGMSGDNDGASLPYYQKRGKNSLVLFVQRPKPYSFSETTGENKESRKEMISTMTETILDKTGFSEDFQAELETIAHNFRAKMTNKQKFRELVTACLTTLPALGAASYVLLTGDLVAGAPNVFTALSGLFGLNDLLAVVSIPAAQGLNELDKKNLENLLSEIYAAWLKEKEKVIELNILHYVSGATIESLDAIVKQTKTPLEQLSIALKNLSEEYRYE